MAIEIITINDHENAFFLLPLQLRIYFVCSVSSSHGYNSAVPWAACSFLLHDLFMTMIFPVSVSLHMFTRISISSLYLSEYPIILSCVS